MQKKVDEENSSRAWKACKNKILSEKSAAASTESHQKAQNCTKSHMSRTEGKIAGIPIFGYLIKI